MENGSQELTLASARLFVYGALRKGFHAHGLMQGFHARFLGTGWVKGRLYDLGKYPGALESTAYADRVHGEIYLLSRAADAFRALDRLEGFDPANPGGNLFERKETTVKLAGGREMRAWIYWLPRVRACGRRIVSGNYALRRS